jgi:prepilin-type processing-associated H-X9-DG protein
MRELLRSPLARVWVPVLSCAAVVAYLDRGTDPGDLVYFVHRGEHLLSGGWASTFADPMLQSGPLQLAVFGAVRNLTALAFLIQLGVACLLLYVAGRVGANDRIRLVVGLLAVGAGLTNIAFVDGHPAEAFVPLLWVLAGVWAREDRALRAGALIGLSSGLELWGVLGLPVLLLAPRRRRALAGAAVEAAVFVGMLAPFALAGSFRMFQYDWRVASGTVLSLFVTPGAHFGWPLRVLQSALALSAGASVAVAFRRGVHACWLVPLAVALVRLVLDPLSYGWYWLEIEALVLVGAALLLTSLPTRVSPATTETARV